MSKFNYTPIWRAVTPARKRQKTASERTTERDEERLRGPRSPGAGVGPPAGRPCGPRSRAPTLRPCDTATAVLRRKVTAKLTGPEKCQVNGRTLHLREPERELNPK